VNAAAYLWAYTSMSEIIMTVGNMTLKAVYEVYDVYLLECDVNVVRSFLLFQNLDLAYPVIRL